MTLTEPWAQPETGPKTEPIDELRHPLTESNAESVMYPKTEPEAEAVKETDTEATAQH